MVRLLLLCYTIPLLCEIAAYAVATELHVVIPVRISDLYLMIKAEGSTEQSFLHPTSVRFLQ